MNAAAKKWVKALRSGKYKQTIGHLADETGFCCLGVACELAKQAGIIPDYNGTNGNLPTRVQNWLGLQDRFGKIDGNRKYNDLTSYNDFGKWSFKKIANLIERQPKGLFKEAKRGHR